MNYFVRSFFYLCSIHLVWSQQVINAENTCYTSNGHPGICKTQQQCLDSQSSSGSSTRTELISETCRIENDGTPVVCCIINADSSSFQPEDNDTYTYVEQESSGSLQNSSKSNSSDIESRFFNGPRKRQYYNYNVIPQYEPISYNDVYSYQNKKPNDVNYNQNYNSFAYESPANQYKPTSNNNFNNYNYNSYNTPSRNPTSRPVSANNNPQSWQSSQTTRRPGGQQTDVIFKQTGSASNRLSTATNRYNPNLDSWGTSQTTRRSDIQPIWGEVQESTTTTRVIRTPRPTESYQNNQNQNVYRPAQNQNQNNQNQNQYPYNQNQNTQNQYPNNQNQYQNNQNRYPNNQNQYPNNQNQYQNNQNQQNQNSNQPIQTQQKRISEQKCNEYAKLVTHKVSAVPLSINAQVSTVERPNCPPISETLIVGGSKAHDGEFPHMAALGYKTGSTIEYSCGGTLISEEYVLTAAHCIKSALGDPIHVKLGILNVEKNGNLTQIIGVSQIFVHPRYKSPQLYHDIAVIKLSRSVDFQQKLRPACLYPVNEISSPNAIATGWGSTNYGEKSSDDLLQVVLNIIDNKQCNSLYGTDTKLKNGITGDMVCAGELSGKRDTCQGDSGGPLQITSPTHNCIHFVIGITSFGRSCGVPNSAGIYTRVSQYIDWIESVVWN